MQDFDFARVGEKDVQFRQTAGSVDIVYQIGVVCPCSVFDEFEDINNVITMPATDLHQTC